MDDVVLHSAIKTPCKLTLSLHLSVLGIIAIPGMMTGAILGGSSVQEAARLQIIIIFMISSSTALASILTTFSAIAMTVDWQHRIRTDRIYENDRVVWRAKDWSAKRIGQGYTRLTTGWKGWMSWVQRGMGREKVPEVSEERRPLLG